MDETFLSLFFSMACADDYGLLLQAEALLEDCLLENVALLRSSTPLSENTHPKLAQAKGRLISLLSRGRLEVCHSIPSLLHTVHVCEVV